MKLKQRFIVAAAIMLATGSVSAVTTTDPISAVPITDSRLCSTSAAKCIKAPEIDAASGTSAIALLTGVVLLVAERSRSRRSSKSDDSEK